MEGLKLEVIRGLSKHYSIKRDQLGPSNHLVVYWRRPLFSLSCMTLVEDMYSEVGHPGIILYYCFKSNKKQKGFGMRAFRNLFVYKLTSLKLMAAPRFTYLPRLFEQG